MTRQFVARVCDQLNHSVPKTKMHLKMSSAANNCQTFLNTSSIEKNGVDPDQPAHMSSLIWVHTVYHRGFLNISADEKSRRLCCDWCTNSICLPVSVADNLYKQLGPSSGPRNVPTKCWACTASKLFENVMVI